MTQVSELSGTHTLRYTSPTAMAAAGTDDELPIGVVPSNATITAVKWTPNAAVTANGTNFTIISVRNRGAAAAGSTLVATRSYAATDSVAFVAESMTLNATAANLNVTAGDVLTFQRLHTASGVAVPGGVLEVSYKIR